MPLKEAETGASAVRAAGGPQQGPCSTQDADPHAPCSSSVLALGALEAAFEEVAGGKVEQRKAEKGNKVFIPGCCGRIAFGDPAESGMGNGTTVPEKKVPCHGCWVIYRCLSS